MARVIRQEVEWFLGKKFFQRYSDGAESLLSSQVCFTVGPNKLSGYYRPAPSHVVVALAGATLVW